MTRALTLATRGIALAVALFGYGATIWGGSPFPVSIRVSADKVQGELEPIWRFFGADEPNYAYMRNGSQLLKRLGELSDRGIFFRAHNLLTSGDGTPALKWGSTNAYREDADGNPVYDWTILDRIFDAYATTGVRPYAQIGFMPQDLSVKPEPYQHRWYPGARYEEIYTGWAHPPKDYKRWEELVYQWVKHCVERYGKEAVETWYWQTWNEPDIGYWQGRPRSESFHRLHDHAIAGVRRALPTAKVGGPDTAYDGRFLREFLDHCLYGRNFATGETGTPLDFISFHAKGGPSIEDGYVRMGIAQHLRGINSSFEVIASYPELKPLPIVIGESDPDGCAACKASEYPQYAYRNGAHYASYTAASFARKHDLAARHGVNLQGALTWAFTFENQPYFAGFRSLATNGIDKPVLNVFRMFSKMGTRRVAVESDHEVSLDEILRRGVRGQPDVAALASADDGRVSILVWHYHDDAKPGDDAAVQLVVRGLRVSSGQARLEHYRIDDRHSNAFTAWQAMGEPQEPSDEQVRQLQQAARLTQLEGPDDIAVRDGEAAIEFRLPRQAVSLIVLSIDSAAHPAESSASDRVNDSAPADLDEVNEPDLSSIESRPDPIGHIAARYRADRSSLERFYVVAESAETLARMRKFYLDWLTALTALPTESLADSDREALSALTKEIVEAMAEREEVARADAEAQELVPFAKTIVSLAEDRQHVRRVDPQDAAGRVAEVSRQIDTLRQSLGRESTDGANDDAEPLDQAKRLRAADYTERLRRHLENWYQFYNGYDPAFTWWMRAPYEEANQKLIAYAAALKGEPEGPGDGAGEGTGANESRDDGRSTAGARQSDVPDLAPLLHDEPTRIQRIIERFQSEMGSLRSQRGARGRERGPRRGTERADGSESRRGDADAAERQEQLRIARARRERLLKKWDASVSELSFDELSPRERVDYLLLRNYIDRELRRLQRSEAQDDRERPAPVDESAIAGRPIGREALIAELKYEMIDYSPEELIAIAESEYAWCQAELRKAAAEMGHGDDWRAAVEQVKTMHVSPGEQPYLIHSLAWEAIDYLKEHDLVTVSPIAAETWRLQMMSPERQLINPFFTGGPTISVSFPTDTMSHDAKLQSMRGNNIPFARATVHHELIPGHNLQAFMNARYATHRRMFATPFWGEGWALYWEMLLYDRGFAKTPEDRVGFLVWRQHRCARIVFSLNYHLAAMKPGECIDYLVDRVGFDRNNATAEVRRSVENAQPLYQAAYMLGGLQFRALQRELVGSGKMTMRQFHDAVLHEGSMPVVLVRALLTGQQLVRPEPPDWRFYD